MITKCFPENSYLSYLYASYLMTYNVLLQQIKRRIIALELFRILFILSLCIWS